MSDVDALTQEIADLRRALETRDTIGMAKGILMSAAGLDADEAFTVLRRASQNRNLKLHDVAADVVARRERLRDAASVAEVCREARRVAADRASEAKACRERLAVARARLQTVRERLGLAERQRLPEPAT